MIRALTVCVPGPSASSAAETIWLSVGDRAGVGAVADVERAVVVEVVGVAEAGRDVGGIRIELVR